MFTTNGADLLFCKNTVSAPGLNGVSLCQTVFLVGFFCSVLCWGFLLKRLSSHQMWKSVSKQTPERRGPTQRRCKHTCTLFGKWTLTYLFLKCFLIFLFPFILPFCAAYYHKQRPALKSGCVMSETWNRRTRPVSCDKFSSAAECKSLFHTCRSVQIFMTECIKVWVCCFMTLELQCWCLVNHNITQYSNMTANLR